jgi:hypothetical protein
MLEGSKAVEDTTGIYSYTQGVFNCQTQPWTVARRLPFKFSDVHSCI